MKIQILMPDAMIAHMQRVKYETGASFAFQVREALRAKMNAERPRGPFPRPDETETEEY